MHSKKAINSKRTFHFKNTLLRNPPKKQGTYKSNYLWFIETRSSWFRFAVRTKRPQWDKAKITRLDHY
jgi:hypothetical protein